MSVSPSNNRDKQSSEYKECFDPPLLCTSWQSEDDRSSLSTHAVEVGGADSGPAPLPQGADVDPTHTDWSQLACLLCKSPSASVVTVVRNHSHNAAFNSRAYYSRVTLILFHSELWTVGLLFEGSDYSKKHGMSQNASDS